jgi:hypothetical protein
MHRLSLPFSKRWLQKLQAVTVFSVAAVIALAVVPSALATYQAAVTADSPSIYWRLGESSGTSAQDETSSGLTGTYLNGVALSEPGRRGSSVVPRSPPSAPKFQ